MKQNNKLILPYAAPYLVYVAIASFSGKYLSSDISYTLQIIFTFIALAWAWKRYATIKGPYSPVISVATGIPAGIIGFVLWIFLLKPFVILNGESAWSYTAFLLRLTAAGILVPIFEEILMRGFIFRFALQWNSLRIEKVKHPLETTLYDKSIDEVKSGEWSWAAVIISTLFFTFGHTMPEWPASIMYGLFMSLLLILRKDLLTCITAHAVTNITLAVYVFYTGNWHYW